MAVSSSANLLELYKQILASSGVTVADNGQCYITMLGLNRALVVDDKAVVLPIDSVMKQFNVEANMAFHPLSESVIRAESAIITKLKQLMTFRLTEVIQTQLALLVDLAADTARHKNLSPEQQEFLRCLPKADAKTAKAVDNISPKDLGEALTQVLDANGSAPKHNVMHMFLKRNGTWNGRKYKRVCIVNFPILEAENSKENSIFGVKVRVNDKPAILNLFKYIVGAVTPEETPYNYGSDSGIAPYFDALIHSFLSLAKVLNRTTFRFKNHMTEEMFDTLYIDTLWGDEIEDLAQYKGLLGPMDGNIGDQPEEDKAKNAATITMLQQPVVNNNLQASVINATPPAPTQAQVASTRKVLEYTMPSAPVNNIPNNPHLAGYPGGVPMMMPQMPMMAMGMPQVAAPNPYAVALAGNVYDVNAPATLVQNGMIVQPGMPQSSGSPGRQAEMAKRAMMANQAAMGYGGFGGNAAGYPMVVTQQQQYYQQPVYQQPVYQQPVQQNQWSGHMV